jgi:radical SAM superfamily enzyme YgiQ (UPF0313 family)
MPESSASPPPDILLATLNARYIHTAFGLRYLYANLGPLQTRTQILEFEIKQRPLEIAAEILAHSPRIVGLGVYIWNIAPSTELVSLLKRLAPETFVILGGPEVSHEPETQAIVQQADLVIAGEADLLFPEVCQAVLDGRRDFPKVLQAPLPKLDQVSLPYEAYSAEDIAHRVLYVEASRGCPFTCEFCLSSLDVPVRAVDLDRFLSSLESLLQRGARTFKFVDRTFNLSLKTSRAILLFFLDRWVDGLFLHFEMVPDRMPAELIELLGRFPPGAIQLEVGIQTFHEPTAALISRRQNYAKLEHNLRALRSSTGVHIHADLIAGLPGETLESFGAGFDRLLALQPQEIQVGLLKRLRGTPIIRHDTEFEMIYNPHPPYEILRTRHFSFEELHRMRRFARFWDLLANSGRFQKTLPLLWRNAGSPFHAFLNFSDWMGRRLGRNHSIALVSLAELLFEYLRDELALPEAAEALHEDWTRDGIKRERLPFLPSADHPGKTTLAQRPSRTLPANQRQKRHHP